MCMKKTIITLLASALAVLTFAATPGNKTKKDKKSDNTAVVTRDKTCFQNPPQANF